MSEFGKKTLSYILAILLVFAPVFSSTGVVSYAAEFNDLNASGVFLKQQTSVTCTLSSAAMMFRRTAICAGYDKWKDITEENIRYKGWIDGVGLRWNFTSYGMTINHGYFTKETEEIKAEVISLLKKYPQGYVIYNGGSQGQNHAVFLCDYDEKNDIFYVADPANNAPAGRIKLSESTIVGETQDEQIKNLTAYWYISDPSVEYSKGKYTADPDSIEPEQNVSQQYDPTEDVNSFDDCLEIVKKCGSLSKPNDISTLVSVVNSDVMSNIDLVLSEFGIDTNSVWFPKVYSDKYINKINEYCAHIFKDIMGLDDFSIKYAKSIEFDLNMPNLKEYLTEEYNKKLDYDIKLCSTSIGPHKDDIEFFLGDKNLKFYGSQGQQRVAVLALKLSEIEIFKKYKETTPILLLDDIFSELDDNKKNNLLKYISRDIQTIITTTDLNNLDSKLIKKSKLFNINNLVPTIYIIVILLKLLYENYKLKTNSATAPVK